MFLLLIACQSPIPNGKGADDTGMDSASDSADTSGADLSAPGNPDLPYANCGRDNTGTDAASGAAVWFKHTDYDASGNWVDWLVDGDADGDYEENWWATHDTSGFVASEDHDDDDSDTSVDERFTYGWRSDGQIESATGDTNADGTLSWSQTYLYDDQGRATESDIDNPPVTGGDPDRFGVYVWTTDGDDAVGTSSWGAWPDGPVDYLVAATYDSEDRLIAYTVDSDVDGVLDEVYAYGYDDAGVELVYQYELYDAGVMTESGLVHLTLDDWGRYSTATYDYDIDGTVDVNVVYTYTCSPG